MNKISTKKINSIFVLNCQIDVEAPAYVRTARYAPGHVHMIHLRIVQERFHPVAFVHAC